MHFTVSRYLVAMTVVAVAHASPLPIPPSSLLKFKANFGPTPKPFKIQVDPEFIKFTKLKASMTRYTEDIEQADWLDGPPRHNITTIRDYWVNEYDWESVEREINKNLTQFTITVYSGKNYTYPIPLHFVHHRSPRSDAIPLLFIHGWPCSRDCRG